jgi:hypothetical protein
MYYTSFVSEGQNNIFLQINCPDEKLPVIYSVKILGRGYKFLLWKCLKRFCRHLIPGIPLTLKLCRQAKWHNEQQKLFHKWSNNENIIRIISSRVRH